ncbi:hypothetical protein BKA70DRAFT_1474370, partial [Coprinopsis sp. MPI-PUGE-AT-0042]
TGSGLACPYIFSHPALYARRSITIDELRHALAMTPDTHSFESSRLMPEAALMFVCRGLIMVDTESRLVQLTTLLKSRWRTPCAHLSLTLTRFLHPSHHRLWVPKCTIHLGLGTRGRINAHPLLDYSHDAWAFHAAKSVDLDDKAAVELLLAHPDTKANLADANGNTPLIIATCKSYEYIVELLLARHLIDVNSANNYEDMALLLAASTRSNRGIVSVLLAHPDIEVKLANEVGDTPLIISSYEGYEDIVALILAPRSCHPSQSAQPGRQL